MLATSAVASAGRTPGIASSGVTVWTPDGKLIGRIRLPEVCGNICFGGPKRNRLFMAVAPACFLSGISGWFSLSLGPRGCR